MRAVSTWYGKFSAIFVVMKGRKRGYKGESVAFGGVHRFAVRITCRKYNDIEPKYLELLMLIHCYDRRGGYWTIPEIIKSSAGAWSRKLVYQYTKVLYERGYVVKDADIKPRAYHANVWNVTTKGEFALNYYSNQSIRLLTEIGASPHQPR